MNCMLSVLLLCLISVQVMAATTFTYRAPESGKDARYNYDTSVLELALIKTRKEYGDFELKPSPAMNFTRAIRSAQLNQYENFFLKLAYENKFNQQDLSFAPFPIDLGIVGYRVCFLSKTIKDKVASAKSFAELSQFTHGQGLGWSDIHVLEASGLKVVTSPTYESLFYLVAANRFDLFCRGANELYEEYNAYKHIKDLTYDTSMSIAYPLPRFFYTHKSNTAAIERVYKGLKIAYKDGSLKQLWLKSYKQSIDFVALGKRQIYWIENPNLKGLESDEYRQYFYDPFKDN
ncbi:hypothetical protein H0A36_03640 [Endozoicomonas sp. SM1973]|uniref:Solute-binding protein family 3/N-terminal domain-containing protein n=1 Tax=Spartinivicinus marinus TaxID=2994442 RepID=A0A853I301_9GAMM|nr:hypothetical protein [Spartinivicinus marinus]MCX4029514.1 hypothetical protein [Spartinivicinus marinus]NYZ65088.1 hypothetical protein [Spartinivicinus marinus]